MLLRSFLFSATFTEFLCPRRPSLRTLHVNLDDALNQGSDRPEEVIRISGNECPEFPEPTIASSLWNSHDMRVLASLFHEDGI
jgi:hypothetical protein